ncbi:MAG: Rieske 2Fe-2S domain-containing protein [Ignavibacteriae bacterium]|nr:Rieske 2Fe-2S domain-containing protein [Ignavibacteriota bacterium]
MTPSSRRNFIKTAVSASVFAATTPHLLLGKILPEFKSDEDSILGIFTVKLDDYPILKQIFGSVKITFGYLDNEPVNGIVTRVSSSDFVACSDLCPHQHCLVNVYDDVTEHLVCPCHQSEFTVDGMFVSGPAQNSLTSYKVIYTGGDSLQIEIPGFVDVMEDRTISTDYMREISPNIVIDNAYVEFGLSSENNVTILIYDNLGNSVRQITNGRYNRGEYHIPISTENLSSGIYICSIIASNGFKADRKFTVIR